GQGKGAPFSFRQPLHPNHRHLLQAKQNCRGIAAATGNDVVTIVDQNRHHKAEGGDTVRDLADLLLRMGSRVARIGFKRVDRDRLHSHESLLLKSRPGTRNFLLPANGRGFLSVSSQSIAKWLIVAVRTAGHCYHPFCSRRRSQSISSVDGAPSPAVSLP